MFAGGATVSQTNTPVAPAATASNVARATEVPVAVPPAAPEKRSWLGSLVGRAASTNSAASSSVPAAVGTTAAQGGKGGASAETFSAPPTPTRGNSVARRMHLRFSGKDAAQQFLFSAARRDTVREEVRVLNRLLREKDAEQKLFGRQLQELFSVRPEGNYQYDAGSLTVFEMVSRAPAGAGATTNQSPVAERRVHLKLKDQAAAQQFLQLVAARQLTAEAHRSLQFMVREKQMEWEQQENGLRARYSISRDRGYQYDAASLTLYEIVEAPAGAGVTGETLDAE
jgi:hypothetical protein